MTRAEYHTYLEQTFDSFTKKVIRNKSIDILREYSRQAKREVSLSELSLSDIGLQASVTDTYQPYRKVFTVKNYIVQVCDPVIGELLQYLTPQRREVILLYYFLDLNDAEIGKLLHLDNTTIKYRRNTALKHLKKMMEDIKDE